MNLLEVEAIDAEPLNTESVDIESINSEASETPETPETPQLVQVEVQPEQSKDTEGDPFSDDSGILPGESSEHAALSKELNAVREEFAQVENQLARWAYIRSNPKLMAFYRRGSSDRELEQV